MGRQMQAKSAETDTGWTAEQAIQGLEGRNAARRGEPFTHANGPYWSAGWLLAGLGISPITNARVRVTHRSWEKH
jgi:hypothetical protein